MLKSGNAYAFVGNQPAAQQTVDNTVDLSEGLVADIKRMRFRKDKTNAALVIKIDPTSLLAITEEAFDDVTLEEIQEALPDNTPRLLLISYVLKHPGAEGRVSYPLVGISYIPATSNTHNKMLYASASNFVLSTKAQVSGKILDLVDSEDFDDEWLSKLVISGKTRAS